MPIRPLFRVFRAAEIRYNAPFFDADIITGHMLALSDNQTYHDQDEFIVEISLFDEFEDEEDLDGLLEHGEKPVLH